MLTFAEPVVQAIFFANIWLFRGVTFTVSHLTLLCVRRAALGVGRGAIGSPDKD